MKRTTMIILFIFILINMYAQTNVDVHFEKADSLFEGGKYQEAIKVLEEIIENNENPTIILKAKLGIIQNCYYNWDLKKAVRIGETILPSLIPRNAENYSLVFYIYWWTGNSYKALNDEKNTYRLQEKLIQLYESNISLLKKEEINSIYKKLKNKLTKTEEKS